MKQDIRSKIEFSEQLNDFEADIEDDLNQRTDDATTKWEFDFSSK